MDKLREALQEMQQEREALDWKIKTIEGILGERGKPKRGRPAKVKAEVAASE